MRAGADDYVTRPFDVEELLRKIAFGLCMGNQIAGNDGQAGRRSVHHAMAAC